MLPDTLTLLSLWLSVFLVSLSAASENADNEGNKGLKELRLWRPVGSRVAPTASVVEGNRAGEQGPRHGEILLFEVTQEFLLNPVNITLHAFPANGCYKQNYPSNTIKENVQISAKTLIGRPLSF